MKRSILISILISTLATAAGSLKWSATLTSTAGASVNTILATATSTLTVRGGVRCDNDANVATGIAYTDGGGVVALSKDPLVIGGEVPEKIIQLLPGENGIAVASVDGGTSVCQVYRHYQY